MVRRLFFAALLGGCSVSSTVTPSTLARQAVGLLADDVICLLERPRAVAMGPAAVRLSDGCIVFDARQMAAIASRYGDAAVVGIFAHEARHAIDHARGVVGLGDEGAELAADRAAGCALSRGGLPLGPLLAYLEDVDEGPPPLSARTVAVLEGAELVADAVWWRVESA